MDRSDAELIEDYCHGGEAAFSSLVRRHVDLVYAAALRHTRDPGMADDVTQAVFIVLAKKARRLRRHATIAGWLIVVTRYVARAAIRARMRRQRHERAGAKSEAFTMNDTDAAHRELADVIDDALSRLRAADRDAITLRYLQSRSLAEVGSALGISEEAARKRVTRGIGRLRSVLVRRGIGTNEAALSVTVATFASPPAPAAVVAAATSTQMAAPPPVISLSKGILRMFAIREITVVSVLIFLTLCAAAVVTVVAKETPLTPAGTVAMQAAPAPVAARPMNLDLDVVAMQMAVTNVEENIAFFKKVGFGVRFMDKPDANGRLVRATVDSGSVRIRMYRVAAAPQPSKNLIPYFWIDGGYTPLAKLHQQIASRGVAVGAITGSGATLAQFDVVTPEGYTIGFYTQP